MSDQHEGRLDALLSREVSGWSQGVTPRPEFLAELVSRDWNQVGRVRRVSTWKRWAWGAVAGLLLALALAGLDSRTIRAFLVPPVFPALAQQTLAGDGGVREGMTVTLPPGPKLFHLIFQAPVGNRRGAEVAMAERCPACPFSFHWATDRELQVYLPADASGSVYTVGEIQVQVRSEPDFLWEWNLRSGKREKIADVTGLTAWTLSPDGRHALLARTTPSDHAPSFYIMDLDSGGRTDGSFALSGIWHPDGGPRLVDSGGRIVDLRGRVVEQLAGDFAQPGPGGATTAWQERGPGAWDLMVRTQDGRALRFTLPEASAGAERVHYPLWNLHWSADGAQLLITQNLRPAVERVFLVSVASGRMTELQLDLKGAFDPVWLWLPDGTRFAMSDGGRTALFDLQGRAVASFEGEARSWSPGGGFILLTDRVTDAAGHTIFRIPPHVRAVGWRAEGVLVLQGQE